MEFSCLYSHFISILSKHLYFFRVNKRLTLKTDISPQKSSDEVNNYYYYQYAVVFCITYIFIGYKVRSFREILLEKENIHHKHFSWIILNILKSQKFFRNIFHHFMIQKQNTITHTRASSFMNLFIANKHNKRSKHTFKYPKNKSLINFVYV